MRIKDVSEKTGLSRRAIRLYIDEKLISPASGCNGYYDFSDEDVKTLSTIKNLRDIGITIDNIRVVLKDPKCAIYILMAHKQKLRMELELKKQQYSFSDQLLNELLSKPFTKFRGMIDSFDFSINRPDPNRPIDNADAELLLSGFLSIFPLDSDWDEFRLFLFERLKKAYMNDQSDDLKIQRNVLYASESSVEQVEECNAYYRTAYSRIASLTDSTLPAFVDEMFEHVREHLTTPLWVKYWNKAYTSMTRPSFSLYNKNVVKIMCQFSPMFAAYYENYLAVCQSFIEKLESEDGRELRDLIYEKLGSSFYVYDYNNIIRLFFFGDSPGELSAITP
ncbi:MerR family transcriptional regulator [Ruminococcus gauvreauii]|uniref:MerR family transcriptional regulator n=1 Tax=Ruminococcus gauvreauii TaxID=438033 RepID=A0ABY5VDC0_9FIRM|nr:MerR family transcriptional regulator [Ruminococcus gauvreauii]UWP58287.1 MerR family transcriptional regulator [Ruminococcus gauvreauii]